MSTGINWKIKNRKGVLLYEELTSIIIGLCFEIHRQYGSGQKESVYQNALEEKLIIESIPYKREVVIKIKSEDSGKVLGVHRLDYVIDAKVVLETKAITYTPVKLERQLYSYLRNSLYEVGLMINFGSSKLYIKRVILSKNPPV